MNSYSKFKALAGVNSIYLNITDPDYSPIATIRMGTHESYTNGSLNISGIVDYQQGTNAFVVDNFSNIDLVSTNNIDVRSHYTSIKVDNALYVIGPTKTQNIIVDNGDSNERGPRIQLDAATIKIHSNAIKTSTDSNGFINFDTKNFNINSTVLTHNGKSIPIINNLIKQVEFTNTKKTPDENKTVSWKFKLSDGKYFDSYVNEFKSAKDITFNNMPIMQITDTKTGQLKLAAMAFDLNDQSLTITLHNVAAEIPANKYKITLIGY